jgi:phage terminase large subunit-like protein
VGITLRLNFCVWTEQHTPYIPMDRWRACGGGRIAAPERAVAPCWGGLDLGQRDDLSAFVLACRLPEGRVGVTAHFWAPRTAVQARRDLYEPWERAGWLRVTEGDVTDLDRVEQEVAALSREARVRDIGYDQRFAEHMALHLRGMFGDAFMVHTGQGYDLNEALGHLLDLVVSGRLVHDDNPILTWMASNLVVRHGTKADVRPDKPAARNKIDGMVALAMALDRMIRTPTTDSIYASRGLLRV